MEELTGKYTLLKPLGKGAMGTVYAAMHRGLQKRVAVKVLHSQHAGDQALKRRFAREAVAVSRLRSRYVVRIFDSDMTPDGAPYIVMELLTGSDLAVTLRNAEVASGEQVADWMIQICSAMSEAHREGIIHRDLKPSNIFLAEPDKTVRVLDFGISRIVEGADLTAGSELLGTPNYMAPEVLQGRPAGPRADLYAIGVIAYRALSRRFPCKASEEDTNPFAALIATVTTPVFPLATLRPDLPAALVSAVTKALAKDPDERFATARDMAEAFVPFGSGSFSFEEVPVSTSRPPLADVGSFPPPNESETQSIDVLIDPTGTTAGAEAVVLDGSSAPSRTSALGATPSRMRGKGLIAVLALGVVLTAVSLVAARATWKQTTPPPVAPSPPTVTSSAVALQAPPPSAVVHAPDPVSEPAAQPGARKVTPPQRQSSFVPAASVSLPRAPPAPTPKAHPRQPGTGEPLYIE